jgi:hypothetical protein
MVSNDNLENNGSSRVKDLVMVNLDQALDVVMQLPREQQETLIDIVRHHHIEQRRDEIVQDAQRSLEEFQAGQYQLMAIAQVLVDLRACLEPDGE